MNTNPPINLQSDAVAPRTERNVGVELFRVFSMFMVVLLHILGRVISKTEPLSANYGIATFLEVLTYCSVNCYALISGFANVKTKFKFRRFVYLWIETVFLIACMNILVPLAVPGYKIQPEWWISGMFPLTKRELWYLCAYFLMYPLILLVNHGLTAIKKWQHITAILLLQMPTVFRLIDGSDNYALGGGYSAMWLLCLYVMGAYFRLYGAPRWARWYVTLPAFFGTGLVAWLFKILPEKKFEGVTEISSVWYDNRESLISYISPCMVVMALMLLLFFMQIKIHAPALKRTVSVLGRATWGVFVVHVSSAIWYLHDFWAIFSPIADMTPAWMLVTLIASALLWYLVFSLLAIGGTYLLKLCRVDRLVNLVADRLGDALDKLDGDEANGRAD